MQQSATNVPSTTTPSKDERNWAMFAHLSGLLVFFTVIGGILGPLVIYLVRKDDMPYAAEQAREALNFQITVFLAALVCWVLVLVLIGFVLLFALCVFNVVFIVIAAIKASEGVNYRYPINLRLVN